MPGQSRVGNLDVDLTAPQLSVQGVPAERLVGKAVIRGGAVNYSLEGKTLGGSFEVKGRYPGNKKANPVPPADDKGSFRLTGLDLARVAPDVGLRSLAPLRGRVDATFSFENDLSAGAGRVIIRDLQWGSATASREPHRNTGTPRWTTGTDRRGRHPGGRNCASAGRLNVTEPERNFFRWCSMAQDARLLFAPIPEISSVLEGRVTIVLAPTGARDARFRIAGVTSWDGLGRSRYGSAHSLRMGHRAGRLWAGLHSRGRGSSGIGSGRANVTVEWGVEARVTGLIRFAEVPLRTLAPSLDENALLGNGRITGRFDLGGSRVRSVDDLSGTLIATLNQTSVRELPSAPPDRPLSQCLGSRQAI